MFGEFLLLDAAGSATRRAARLPLGDTSGRNEGWLRDMLFEHPGLLPIGEIDPSFGPIVPLCRELRTEAGPVDVTFISPNGRLTLVECKLWRNPEARRKVVVQILDYARALVRWSYSDLQRQVAIALGRQAETPFEMARALDPKLTEHQFVDSVTRNLRSGRFLLLIAGDGIREDVTALTELITHNSPFGFTFGLIELALYDFGSGGIAVQPRVPVRSQVVERRVMVLPGGEGLVDAYGESEGSEVEVGEQEAASEIGRHEIYRAWWRPVIDMRFDDPDQGSPRLHWPNHVRVDLPYPRVWLTAWHSDTIGGSSGVSLSGRPSSRGHVLRLMEPLDALITLLPDGTVDADSSDPAKRSIYTKRPNNSFASDDECRLWLTTVLNSYVNVFRPRLKHLGEQERPTA